MSVFSIQECQCVTVANQGHKTRTKQPCGIQTGKNKETGKKESRTDEVNISVFVQRHVRFISFIYRRMIKDYKNMCSKEFYVPQHRGCVLNPE